MTWTNNKRDEQHTWERDMKEEVYLDFWKKTIKVEPYPQLERRTERTELSFKWP